MRNPMFVYDEHLADMVFDYCRRRLALDPVPLDFGGARESLDTVLDGLVGAEGNDPAHVLEVFGRLAEAVVSCDSPRFLSFIPAAPTKAALLFDMVVSCSSLQGTSWLEAAGAVAAENQALAVLAELGRPPPSGRRLLRRRRHQREPLGPGGGPRHRAPPPGSPHGAARASPWVPTRTPRSARPCMSSGSKHSVVPTDDHRLTGAQLRAALAADPSAR